MSLTASTLNTATTALSATAGAPVLGAAELIALLPIMAIAAGIVVAMLIAAFARSHLNVACATAAALVITLGTLPYASDEIPRLTTPLLLIDSLALYTIALLTSTTLAITLMAYPYFKARQLHREEFYLLLLLALLGAAVLAAANHFAALLLGLETLGVALFCLAAYSARNPVTGDRSLEAGIKYLVLSGVASALILFGMALVYAQSGGLSFDALARNSASATGNHVDAVLFYGGSALLLAGLCFKLSLVPFHLWTPDVYQGAPAPVSAVIATLSKGAIFIVFVRYMVASNSLASAELFSLIAIIAGLSMLVGNWLALLQNNIKRLLAYSSIAHLGYLLVAFLALQGANLALALEACAVYLFAYLFTTAGAFAVVALLSSESEVETDTLEDYVGLFWQRPALALAFTFILLSLAGIPLTVGFIGKFYLFSAGTQAQLWGLLALLIAGSGIGLFYYLRLITAMFRSAEKPMTTHRIAYGVGNRALAPSYAVVLVLTLVLLGVGVYPQPLAEQAQRIAAALQATQQSRSTIASK